MYDNEVLVDPRDTAVTRDLLAGLPVPEAAVTSNIKLVLPSAALRALTHQQIQALVGYLNGDRDTLVLTVDISAVLANVEDLSHIYFGDLVAGLQGQDEPDFDRLTAELSVALGELVDGRAPPADFPWCRSPRSRPTRPPRQCCRRCLPSDGRLSGPRSRSLWPTVTSAPHSRWWHPRSWPDGPATQ
ncbi:hypothetical protein ABZX40_04630 [Streptomyces sp. NPDC004610]|uniref:hypothetical protein n=1 Tax=unclassified Streptomyces TaxID=2593676 RepID=UPI0033BC9DCA